MQVELQKDATEKNSEAASNSEEFNFESWVYEYFTADSIDLDLEPPDKSLILQVGPSVCAQLGILPWKTLGDTTLIFIDDLSREDSVRNVIPTIKGKIVFLPLSRKELVNRLPQYTGREMLREARHYCPKSLSVRKMYNPYHKYIASAFSAFIIFLIVKYPSQALIALMAICMFFVAGNAIIRAGALVRYFREGRNEVEKQVECTLNDDDLPIMSIMIPLFREPELIQQVITSLDETNYPKEKLDVKLVLEADDDLTLAALDTFELPPYVEEIHVPGCYLRTKPKAMNYTLPFCHGEIIGIYDAEDRADPNQLREVSQAFHDASPDVATVQCELTFYNTRQNWFTRCFTIEYRTWFSALLPALQYFGLSVPLGGTSVFFRKNHLINAGAWDAHNVTEDADLGIRLKRLGYETLVISSKTREEANGRPISWVRQRSRWLKGYVISWATHMSNPVQLYKDLGFRGFMAVQILFLGAFGTYLAVPLFWMLWPAYFGYDILGFHNQPEWFRIMFSATMMFSQVVSLSVSVIALRKTEHRFLFWTWFTLPAYWPFGSVAAYKALIELIFAPSYWDKTQHGHGKEDSK